MTDYYATGKTGTIGKHLTSNVTSLDLDLSSCDLNLRSFKFGKKDKLLHLAGIVGNDNVLKDNKNSANINIQGTLNLAEKFLTGSKSVFYFVSTSHVYKQKNRLLKESDPIDPINFYAQQKYETEIGLSKLFKNRENQLCIIRLFSVLDWDVKPFTLGGAIKKIAEMNSEFVMQNSNDIRDFMTPKTIARNLEKIVMSENLFGLYNMCTSIGTSVKDAAVRMLRENNYPIKEEKFQMSNSKVPFIVGDNSKIRSIKASLDLTWNPTKRVQHHPVKRKVNNCDK